MKNTATKNTATMITAPATSAITTPVLTLADLTALTGLQVLDYLDQSMSIPVISEMQAQGDLIVIPYRVIAEETSLRWPSRVPLGGIELLRSAAGGNPHTLVADAGVCMWESVGFDPAGLTIGLLETQVAAYLIHPEHGATGIAPGRYAIRRQRELGIGGLGEGMRFVAD